MLLSARIKGFLVAVYATIMADLLVCTCMGYESAAIAFVVMVLIPLAISYMADEEEVAYVVVVKEAE